MKRFGIRPAAVTAAVAVAGTIGGGSASAAPISLGSFLTVPGYATTTLNSTMGKVQGTMDISEWSFGLQQANPESSEPSQRGVFTGDDGSGSPSSSGGFSFNKVSDANSPKLFTDIATGTRYARVILTANRGTAKYMKYCFGDVVFTGDKITPDDATVSENVSFSYSSMVMSFSPTSKAGQVLTPIRSGWSDATRLVLGGADLDSC